MRLAQMDKSIWADTIRRATETAAATLDIARAGVWLFSDDGTECACHDLYDARGDRHEAGAVWKSADYPRYLRALQEKRSIPALDARTDPDTSEFAEGYLEPLGITSMLDVPIWHRGRLAGVLCHEHVGPPRPWTAEDQDFAAAIAEVIAISLEARARRKTEDALRVSENRFRTMFEQFPMSVQILSPEGYTLQVNRAWEELFGLSGEDMRGVNLLEDPQLHENGVLPLLERGFRGEPTVVPPVLYDPTRNPAAPQAPPRWLQGFVFPVKDEEGATREVIVVHEDVTRRRRAERELQESQERFRSAFERSSIGMALIGLADRYLQVNQAFCSLFGYTAEEMEGMTTLSVSHPEDMARLGATKTETQSVIAGQSDSLQVEKRYRRKDGSFFWAVVGVSMVRDAEGNPLYWISQVQDITERKRAEEELRRTHEELEARVAARTAELAAANAELQAIFRALPDLYFRLASDGTILDYRAGTAWGLYAPPEEFMGKRMQDVLPPDVGAQCGRAIEQVAAHGEAVCIEYALPIEGGEGVFEARLVRLLSDCGDEILAVVRDITDRVRVERALQQSEEHFRTVTENSSDVVAILEKDGTIRYQSPASERVFGYTPEEMAGHWGCEFFIPEDIAPTVAVLEKVVHNPGTSHVAHFRLQRKDGRIIHCEAVGRTLLPHSAEAGVVVNTRDITERKEAEQALREGEERLRFALAAGGMGTFEWFVDTDRVSWSPSLQVIHGLEPGTFGGTFEAVMALLHPEDRARVAVSARDAVTGQNEYGVEYRCVWPDGSVHWLDARGRIIRDEAGKPLRMVGVSMDITARRQGEEALRRAKEEAEAANRAKSDFLSRMSHELRTPMNSILGFAQILGRKPLPPDQMRSVDYILKAGRHLLELINEVLDIARIESNRLQLSLEPVRVGAVISEALSLIQPLAAQRDCRIEGDGAVDLDVYVLEDRQRLTQVLLNLLSNAVKYNRPGGVVSLSCERVEDGDGDRDRLLIRVRDSGLGIAPEKMSRLFTPFERLGAEQSDIEGTGLGLALSKRLVEVMEGDLTAESVQGQGSTFIVTLSLVESPLERLERRGHAPAVADSSAPPEQTATLLYIEDNLANLSLIETILVERAEIRLLSALQGRLGLELAWEHRPDLILLDLHLPDMMGDVVLKRLQAEARTRDIPVLVISADATPGTIERLNKAGARGYLPKPLDVELFLKTIDEIIDEGQPGP
jgi:PAS domain S-box-containing protein